MRQLQGNKSHQGKKSIIIPILLLTLTISLSGCDLWEGVKWIIGVVNYGRIEGTVTDIEGNAVEGMTVTAYPTGVGTRQTEFPDTTDSDGNYTLNKVPPGIHKVEARKEGYDTCAVPDVYVWEAEKADTDISNIYRIGINTWYSLEDAEASGQNLEIGRYYAQSFKPEVSSIRSVKVYGMHAYFHEDACEDLSLEIREDDNGNPGTLMAAGGDIEGAYFIPFIPAVSVTPGATYWLVLYVSTDEFLTYHFLTEDVYEDGVLKHSADGIAWDEDSVLKEITFTTLY